MSSGLFVILFVAALVVVAPSVLLLRAGWRRGGLVRKASIGGAAFIGLLAILTFSPSDYPNSYEERLVFFLIGWGLVLLFLSTVVFVVLAGVRAIQNVKRPPELK